MSRHRLVVALPGVVFALACTAVAALAGQTSPEPLVVSAGRPLRVLLDNRVRVSRVGQPITATLTEDVYAYDRVAIPAGSKVLGHVAKLAGVSAVTRTSAMLGGNFTPGRLVGLEFDSVRLPNGLTFAIQTVVLPGSPPTTKEVAGAHDDGVVGHARQQIASEASRTIASVKGPGKATRFGHYLVGRLPIHPQYLEAGSAFNAQLLEPITVGSAERLPRAPAGTRLAAAGILNARLLTPLDSKTTLRGAPVKAVLSRPLLSAAQEVILPEGTVVTGKVTFVKQARGLRRNGQLRFLFESMDVPGREAETVSASLFSADVGDQHVEIDDEGGAKVTNPKSRFIAPALASAAMVVPLTRTEVSDEALGALTTEANVVGHGVRGFSGFGLLGAGLAVASRPAAIALGAFGLSRAVYGTLLGKGGDVVFPMHTSIQLQLASDEPPER